MSNFDPNAIIRGAQLTLVGAYRALQNPKLFETKHYQYALAAVVISFIIQIIVALPVFGVKNSLWFLGFIIDLESAQWDDNLINGLEFIEKSVLQLPYFLMIAMRYITPTLDELFMTSLDWVDETYLIKHASDDQSTLRGLYHRNLQKYPVSSSAAVKSNKKPYDAVFTFLLRYARKAGISIAVYVLSFTPVVGRFVLPAASFYSLGKALGPAPACTIFVVGLFVPRSWMVIFLQGYFASRGLMRELLEPYFSRIKFTKEQKKQWFYDREGLLFGFGVGFYLLIKVPILGVLIYGIAEASTAYLVTKITDPPPEPEDKEVEQYKASQVKWQNKHEFLKLDLDSLDKLNVKLLKKEGLFNPLETEKANVVEENLIDL
ncbi:hypothetical protein RUND412_009915 [Rhizina undulata]